ncbi:MAG: hypothetical protein FWF84_03650 [Kiritimatiellaeota bacterium]|nr:hypothetical protein [Kiritimatiellota bacterium]
MKKIMAMMAGVTVAVAAGAREFALEEHFGVSHPEQIVTFDVPEGFETKGVTVSERRERADGNAASAALRPSVPFQFVDGGRKLAVKTGLLPGERVTWGVEQGKAAFDAKGLVTVRELPSDAWEVDNGLIAIRVPRFSGWTATSYADAEVKPLVNIFNTSLQEAYWPRQVVLAPVQGVRLADGTWTGIGPNTLMALAKETLGISAEVVEAGPLRVVIKIRYEFIHTEISGGRGEKVTMPEGPGFYETTVTMDAGQPSVLFEEETDMNVAWGMNVYEGVAPTQARWRGHHASRVEYGRKSDGSIYNGYNYGDAMTDLQYERAQVPNYNTSENTWRYLVVWDPWAYDSGWYWLAYNSDQWSVVSGQQDGGNLVGIFAGRASRAIGAAISGAGIFTLPEDPRTPGKKCFGIAVQTARNSPDARFFTHTRFQWGLYSAALSALRPPEEVQDINVQMNIHGGVNLDKASRWVLDFPDPPDGYGTTYMGRKGIDVLRQRTKDEDPAYYRWLYNNDTYSRILYDAWREEGREKYDECVEQTLQAGHNMMENLVNQGGIYNMSVHYWHGGLEAMRYGVWIDQLLNDPRLTPEQEAKLKGTLERYGLI